MFYQYVVVKGETQYSHHFVVHSFYLEKTPNSTSSNNIKGIKAYICPLKQNSLVLFVSTKRSCYYIVDLFLSLKIAYLWVNILISIILTCEIDSFVLISAGPSVKGISLECSNIFLSTSPAFL